MLGCCKRERALQLYGLLEFRLVLFGAEATGMAHGHTTEAGAEVWRSQALSALVGSI